MLETYIRVNQSSHWQKKPSRFAKKQSESEYCLKDSLVSVPEKLYYFFVKNDVQVNRLSIEDRFKNLTGYSETIPMENSRNFYLVFKGDSIDPETSLEKCKQATADLGLVINRLSKLPLDLNKSSKVLLITIFSEKADLDAVNAYNIFKAYGSIAKIIVFKKKNTQIFIEFYSIKEAERFRKATHNKMFADLFFLKVQFTKKSFLKIKRNSRYECDFTDKENQCVQGPYVKVNKVKEDDKQSLNTEADSQKDEQKSKSSETEGSYIKLSNLDKTVRHRHLFNLFSLYGKLSKINLDKKTRSATVLYEEEFSYQNAYNYLQNISIGGKPIEMELSEDYTAQRKSSIDKFQSTGSLLDVKSTKKNLPSFILTDLIPYHVLQVKGLKKLKSKETIKAAFEKVEEVVQIRHLNLESSLFYFNNINAAVKVLMQFRGKTIEGEILRLSFANKDKCETSIEIQKQTVSVQNLNVFKSKFAKNKGGNKWQKVTNEITSVVF